MPYYWWAECKDVTVKSSLQLEELSSTSVVLLPPWYHRNIWETEVSKIMPFAWIQFLEKPGLFNIFTGAYTTKFNDMINFPSKETNFLVWNQARNRSWIIWSKWRILSFDTLDGKWNQYWEHQPWYQAYKQWWESCLA